MYIVKIDTFDQDVFDAILPELPELCTAFTCYPSEKMFLLQTWMTGSAVLRALTDRRLNDESFSAVTL